MASTSAPPNNTVSRRLNSAVTTLCTDNHYLIGDIRGLFNTMKDLAVDLEKDNKSDMVNELEAGVMELLGISKDCSNLSTATQSIVNVYRPTSESTDFKKLLDNEIAKAKAASSSTSQNEQLLRQFKEAVWKVHHAGWPMPGDEEEDIVMAPQPNILNKKCPLTGKAVVDLAEPVRSMDCKHIYDKIAVTQYMRNRTTNCPVAGCPKQLHPGRVNCDAMLPVDIQEIRTLESETARPENIEDFTAL